MMYENIDFNSIDLTQEPPVSEPERQYYFIAKCRQYVKEPVSYTHLTLPTNSRV